MIGRNEVRTCGVRSVSLAAQHKLLPRDAALVFPYLCSRESRLQSWAEDRWTMKMWDGVVVAQRKEEKDAEEDEDEDEDGEEDEGDDGNDGNKSNKLCYTNSSACSWRIKKCPRFGVPAQIPDHTVVSSSTSSEIDKRRPGLQTVSA